MVRLQFHLRVHERVTVVPFVLMDVPGIDTTAKKGKWYCASEYVGRQYAGWYTVHPARNTPAASAGSVWTKKDSERRNPPRGRPLAVLDDADVPGEYTITTHTEPKRIVREGPGRQPREVPSHTVVVGGYTRFFDAEPNSWHFLTLDNLVLNLNHSARGWFESSHPDLSSLDIKWRVVG